MRQYKRAAFILEKWLFFVSKDVSLTTYLYHPFMIQLREQLRKEDNHEWIRIWLRQSEHTIARIGSTNRFAE